MLQSQYWHRCSGNFYHNGDYGGAIEAAGEQGQACKHLSRAWAWLLVVPEVKVGQVKIISTMVLNMMNTILVMMSTMVATITIATGISQDWQQNNHCEDGADGKEAGREKKYLVAVTRSEEKERKMAMSSPQAAAQTQEGGPAKLSQLLRVT